MSFKIFLERHAIYFSIANVSGIVTGTAPSAAHEKVGLVKLIEDDAMVALSSSSTEHYCIAQQELLCRKAFTMYRFI